ncbi:MAG: hypothetical protein QME66_05500 [Candidatus Eisenbacteria bacterium]|nr:hypothetical protein [Candidatus Eisenbacteria bacterium]
MPTVLMEDQFFGGLSSGEKRGIVGSFAAGRNLDYRTEPDRLSVATATANDSGVVVTDLIKWFQPTSGSELFALGSTGQLYRRTGGAWSVFESVGGAGQGMTIFNDYLWFANATDLRRYGPLSDGPSSALFATLTTDADWHPMVEYQNFICIGAGRTLTTVNDAGTRVNQFSFPIGWRIKSLAVVGDYLAIGCMRGSAITDFEDGLLAYWDGNASTYLSPVWVKESGVNAFIADQNTLYVFAGTAGNVYATGAMGRQLVKVKRIPGIVPSYAEVWPGAVSLWKGLIHAGIAGTTNSTTFSQGVYTYGATDKNYAPSLNLEYTASTGTGTGTTLQIGAVRGVDPQNLYVGVRDGVTFRIDRVTGTTPFTTATYTSRIYDASRPFERKLFSAFRVNFAPLGAGQSVAIAVAADRAAAFTTLGTEATADTTTLRASTNIKAYDIQVRLTLTAGAAAPRVLSFAVTYDFEPIV